MGNALADVGAVAASETREEVRAVLARLPERSAALLALRYAGLSYAEISAAIVDVQLGAEDAAEVCRHLKRRRIPFVFYTGRTDVTFLHAQWPDVSVLKKPAAPEHIVTALTSLLRPQVEQ